MRTLRLAVLGGLVWALAPGIGQAATLDVCATACTYSSIQAAVDAAAPGGTIDIQAGTYAGDVDVSVASLTLIEAGARVFIDGAAGIVLAPLLVWEPSYNALTYDVVLATQPPPAGILETVSGITATHWKPQVALSPGTTYYWQIRGHSPCGRREVSAVCSFTTQ